MLSLQGSQQRKQVRDSQTSFLECGRCTSPRLAIEAGSEEEVRQDTRVSKGFNPSTGTQQCPGHSGEQGLAPSKQVNKNPLIAAGDQQLDTSLRERNRLLVPRQKAPATELKEELESQREGNSDRNPNHSLGMSI